MSLNTNTCMHYEQMNNQSAALKQRLSIISDYIELAPGGTLFRWYTLSIGHKKNLSYVKEFFVQIHD